MLGGTATSPWVILLLLLLTTSSLGHRCDRTPEGHVSPKIPADNRFQLKISGSPDKYVPGEGYTISLQGLRSHGQVAAKFTGFMLVVEPQHHIPMRGLSPRDVTPRPVGTFQLYGDTLTKFSPSCPNMVTHTSSMPKSEVQVRWTAPPPGSGCVIFRATVIEHRDVWYQDDGPLSKMLCEEVQESHDTQPEVLEHCCACDEAKYEVTFEGLWSRHTHPKDFPSNSWLTRFSDVIGASHSSYYRFWEYGGIASEGLRQVAERGSTRMLESELKSQSQNIRTIIKARGISYPNVTGKTFAVFRVDRIHHLMSLVSMIDPSPDWIVGVSALELCLRNCSWVESKVLNLYPWDAGTDSGVTYISPDQQTVPRDKIRRITSSFPNDPKSPFYDPSGAEMKPLARLYLTRQRLYEKTCDDEPMTDDPCALTEWTHWNSCSSSCGPGYQYRVRNFIKKGRNKCPRPEKLSQRKYCMLQQCRMSPQPTEEPIDPKCEVSEWADWSRCEPVDNRCERGMQKRYRHVTARDNYRLKYCLSVKKVDERECILSSSFSICPKNKQGKKVFFPGAQGSTCCADDNGNTDNEETGNEEEGGEQGEDNEENEQDNDTYDKDNENDGDNDNRYDGDRDDDNRYDGDRNDDNRYGGNRYDGNRYDGNRYDGNRYDGNRHDGNRYDGNRYDDGNENEDYEDGTDEPAGECAMTKWSEWSPCSVTCGVGETRRFRYLLNPPEGDDEPRAEYRRASRTNDEDYGTDDDLEGMDGEGDGGQGGDGEGQAEYAEGACSIYKTQEVMPCNGTYPTCQFSEMDAREICSLPPHPGRCPGPMVTRFFYNPKLEDCAEFEWTGCRGNRNRFLSREECRTACQAYTEPEPEEDEEEPQVEEEPTEEAPEEDPELNARSQLGEQYEGTERPVVDCKFSRWSAWSKCDAACGQQGYKVRTRYIEVHAKNGGKACTGKTRKQRKCSRKCRHDEEEEEDQERSTEVRRRHEKCRYSEWSEWTECTATCGYSAMRQRTRLVLEGNNCNDRIRQKPCNVGPCPGH
ncbi:spondin-1-like isoform X2 [Macrosteles quadrilineatus]|uniref:spondin-1-like isoform X2 n=1 Tax=Macrosteles quadrilineatus TaxID=74068 RepID=UPI0023E26320|nr:spondin-1-like isoform X2 [Macrosteles quadrilineatus]